MKRLNLVLSVIIAIALATSCNLGKRDQSGHEGHDHSGHETGSVGSTEDSHNINPGDIAAAYLKLKDALVKSDVELAQLAANELEIAFHNAKFHSEADLVEKIAQDDNLEEQRKVFKVISEQMYKLATENKFEFNTLYKQYCPMAFDNTGAYWLSDSKEIFNPYFGDKMLRCGKVEETLAKK